MERAAIRIYWYASVLAVVEAFLLFILGLDLRVEQVKTLFIFGFPAPIIDDTAARLSPAFVLGIRSVLTVRGKAQPGGVVEIWSAKSS